MKMSNEEVRKGNELHQEYLEKYHKKKQVISFFRNIFFTPLSIIFKLLSKVFDLSIRILFLAIPVGLFYGFLAYLKYKKDIPLLEILEIRYAIILFSLPFLASLFSFIADKLSEFFLHQSLK